MRIFVTKDGEARELWVLPSDSISSLKATIMDEFGLTEEKIQERLLVLDDRNRFNVNPPILLTNGCDLLLEPHQSTTLDACGIKAGSTLRLGRNGLFLLTIVIDDGELTDEIEVCCYDTIESLIPKVEAVTKELVTENNFPRVLLSQAHRTLLSLGYYKPSDNEHMEPCIHLNRDNCLPTENPEYDGEYIDSPELFQITIDIPNLPLRFPLLCMPTQSLEDLKSIIACYFMRERLRLPEYLIKCQFVLFLGDRELDDDSATLADCGIQKMASLKLFEDASFLLGIRSELHNLHMFDIEIKCFHTIDKLREKLHYLIDDIPKDELHFTYKEWRLDDNARHFLDYVTPEMKRGFLPKGKLVEGIVIHLSLPSAADEDEQPMPKCRKLNPHPSLPPSIFGEKWIQIVVELPNMPWRFPLNVEPTSTIADVKWAIMNKYYWEDDMLLGQRYIKEGKFVLVCGRKDLENESMTLADYGIRHIGSIQLLESSCFGITISAPCLGLRGNVLEMRCFDTVRMLKEKLWKVGNFDKEKKLYVGYILELDCVGPILFLDDDDRRLVDYGIAKQVEYDESLVCINPKIHRSWNQRKERHRICVSPSLSIVLGPLFMSSLYG